MVQANEIFRYQQSLKKVCLTRNVKKFKKFCKKWQMPCPKDDMVIEITMNKIIYHSTDVSDKERQKSKKWLEDNGFSTSLS